MNETKIHWGQLGAIVVGLLGLSLVTVLILKKGDETTNIWLATNSATTATNQEEDSFSDKLLYRNQQHGFRFWLPQSWHDYRVFQLDDSNREERLVGISLPVDHYRDVLIKPNEVQEKGVFVIGVRIVARDYVEKERERCRPYQSSLERYQETLLVKEKVFAADGAEQDMIDACLSLYDPASVNPVIQDQYLGKNEKSYFFRVALEAFDNGFRQVPAELKEQIDEVYQTFQAE